MRGENTNTRPIHNDRDKLKDSSPAFLRALCVLCVIAFGDFR